MDKDKALQNIATKGKVQVSDLAKELGEIIESMAPSPDREVLAMRELNRRYSGPPDESKKYSICFVGRQNLTDFNGKTLKDAMVAFNKDKVAALESGVVKMEGSDVIVVDLKKTFGSDNTVNNNYGKALGNSWNRNTLILVREDGGSEWAISNVALRGDFARGESLPAMYKVINCNLIGSIAEGLKTVKTSKFAETDEAIDYNGLLNSLGKDNIVLLGDTLDEARKHTKADEGFYNRYIITSGEVKFMNDPKKEGNSYNGMIDDFTTDKMVTVFVDPSLEKPEIGEIYSFVGQTSVGHEYDKDTQKNTEEEKVIMNVMGFFP